MLYQLSYLAAVAKCSAEARDAHPTAAPDTFRSVRRPISIIGAPLDLGQTRRGVDMGPSAIRYAGLEERLTEIGLVVTDEGNVVAPEPEALTLVDERARYLPEILDACAQLASLVAATVTAGARPLVLGGDQSIALGTLGGLAAAVG